MAFFRRLRHLFNRRRSEAEMAEEMRQHLEHRASEFASEGLPPDEARYAAQRRFGNLASIQEQAREAQGWGWLERFVRDLQFAARQLLRSPGFSLLAIVTLGLGIGANTSMFSLVNGIMLKPLPYADLDRLSAVYRATPQKSDGGLAPADFLDLQKVRGSYGDFAAYRMGRVSLSDPGQAAQIAFAAQTSANLFSVLGVPMHLGRAFLPGEDTPGRHRVVILSQRLWLNRYGGSPAVIGRKIRVDGEPHEVIGVLPQSFNDWRHLGNFDFFRPLAFTPEFAAERRQADLSVVARRDASIGPAQATAFIAEQGARAAREFPEINTEAGWRTVSLQQEAVGSSGEMVLPMLVGLSAFVLLIACSNLANLLLARTMARSREFAVRGALGASRLQLLRPLAAEALLLSLVGGTLAVFVAGWFRDWAAIRSTGDNGEQVHFAVDWLVMGWAFLASLVTALAFGLAPALFALRLDLNHTLKSGGRGAPGGRGHQRFRRMLIVGQFALAMVLLAGAALFIRGLHDLHHRRSGWESAQSVTGAIVLPTGTYGETEKLAAFHRLALERLAALPGIEAAALASAAPSFHWTDVRKFLVEGLDRPEPGREPAAMVNTISPRYLDVFGLRVTAGRGFLDRDDRNAPRVYLVSQSTARAFFGAADPVGRRLAVARDGAPEWGEIVGVVADFENVDPDPNKVVHRVYQPLAQEPRRQFELAVRVGRGVSPATVVDAIRSAITDLDSDLPIRRLQPLDQSIARTLYQLGVLRDMLGAFGVLGLALASLGVYGVIARTMAQRTGEFAIRLAIGARVSDIIRLVLASGVRLALTGSALGIIGAIGVSRVLASAFPGVRADNLSVLSATAALLVGVALLACWLPARRAGKIDAIAALRAE